MKTKLTPVQVFCFLSLIWISYAAWQRGQLMNEPIVSVKPAERRVEVPDTSTWFFQHSEIGRVGE